MLNQTASRTMFIITFLLATLCLNSKPYEKYEDMLTDFKNLSIDESKIFKVTNYKISKEDAEINLSSGTFYLCKPINGRYMAAVFIGDGEFTFIPPTKAEIRQLERVMDTDTINSKIKRMLIFFADNTAEKIEQAGLKATLVPEDKPEEVIKDFLDYEIDYKKNNLSNTLATTLLNDNTNDYFYSYIKRDDLKDYFYQFNPYHREEVRFIRGDWYALGKYNEAINQYQCKNADTKSSNPNKDIILIDKYTINTNIGENLQFKVNATLDITCLDPNTKWVLFSLADELNINSVKLADGTPLTYYKSLKNSEFWVKLPAIDKSLTINIDYQGDILDRWNDYTYMKTSIGWYPVTGNKQLSLFDLTFTTPKSYKFICVGDLISNEKVDKTMVSHWLTPYRIRNASFNIGDFRSKKYDTDGPQELELLYIETAQANAVIEDAAYSVDIYSKLFGPIPPKKLTITEIPYSRGEAFPGLVHLLWQAFKAGQGDDAYYAHFCAHEVAHQWWGINVDFDTYRDQWLSEGLTQYSAMLYLQLAMEDKKDFFEFLDDIKKVILEARVAYLGKSVPPGPISLGYRNNSSKTEGDYLRIVYDKGAWVFHMLRNMMLDVSTMDDTKFFKLLKEFYQENAGKSVTTAVFKKKAESIMDEDLGWFFDQWVDGYKIPKYKFAYKTEKTESGYYKVSCRVEQSEVPADFKMDVIMKVDFGGNKLIRLKQNITGEVTEFELPLLESKPKNVIFNDLGSVLCEVDNVGW